MAQPWSYKDFVKDALTRIPEVSCEQLSKDRSDRALLDVREADETAGGILTGAVLLPRGMVEKHVHEHIPRRDQEVVVYCSTGNRSALVADVLVKMGYSKAKNLAGGIERWRHLGLPISGSEPVSLEPGAKLDWEAVRAEFAIVGRRVPVLGSAERPLVYLDHAASTHAPASVLDAYVEFVAREYANIHRANHHLSRKATERFDEAYTIVADYLGAELKRGTVVFTNNTTQALDLASHVMANLPGKVLTTELEHHSNELTHRRRGQLLRARVNAQGELDVDHLEQLLRKNEVKLVAITAGSNVTGFMPDLAQVARLAHENGALILVDAAQALARLPIDVKPFDHPEHLDFVAGAGHKAYAPFGAGFLYGPRALMTEASAYLPGGGTAAQVTARSVEYLPAPDRHQGGTPNIAGVVGMAKALQFLTSIGLPEVRAHEVKLMKRLLGGMKAMDGVTVYGSGDAEKRLGVAAFNVDGVSDLLTAAVLSEEGAIAVRNGRFCAHIYVDRLLGKDQPNRPPNAPTGAVRCSVGLYNDETDVDRLLEFVGRVRDRKWKGNYKVKGDTVSAEFAGRCADRWMEASNSETEAAALPTVPEPELGYEFQSLNGDDSCRSYLIADPQSREAALVDPVREHVEDYVNLITEKRYTLRYTIETHTHADHISGSMRLKELTGAKMLMHANSPAPCVDQKIADGEKIPLGKLRIGVVATPGHTHDGVCLVLPGRVLTGDTLLISGVGRTDLPTGSSGALFQSLQKLVAGLPDDTIVLPAHDYEGRTASTIGREKQSNPRLQVTTEPAFTAAMDESQIGMPPPSKLKEALRVNLKCL